MNHHFSRNLVVQLGFIVSYIRNNIEPYLDRILDLVQLYWSISDIQMKMIAALIDLVQSISNVMDVDFKPYLPRILPLIIKQLQTEIKDGSCTNTSKLLFISRTYTDCLKRYIHILLPEFIEYLDLADFKSSTKVKQVEAFLDNNLHNNSLKLKTVFFF